MKVKDKDGGATVFTIAIFFIGLFVGAGFMSGQELWQFFGKYKGIGVIFLVLGAFLQGFLGFFIVKTANKNQAYNLNFLPFKNNKILNSIFSFAQIIFTFFTVGIMIAGANSLYESLFLKSGFWFSVLFTFLVGVTAYFGIDGIVLIFKVVMPMLIIISAIIFFVTLRKNNSFSNVFLVKISVKDAFNALKDSLIYVFHNVYLGLALLIPFSKKVKNNEVSIKGFLLSSLAFSVFSVFILTPLIINSNFAVYSLPLLELSKTVSPFIFYVFSFFLCVAMFSSCLSSSVAIIDVLSVKTPPFLKNKVLLIGVCISICFILSLIGFKSLISIIYPISGYLGIIFTFCLLFYSRKAKIK
ncbi:MAG: hypothetical protein J6R29_03845 [Clostridia bacterium]|nr:hypothetical protein [Clostridia bacterium]